MANRFENATRNLLMGVVNYMAWIILPFLLRTVIIYVLGEQYLGLNGLFSSILQVFNIADIGLSSAIQASMYQPIAEKDHQKISALIRFYRNVYSVVGIVILIISVCCLPFLPNLIQGTYPEDVNIYVLFMLYALNAALGYLLFSYSPILINAHQRGDITASVALVSKLLSCVLELVVLLVWRSIVLYVLCNVICTVTQNILNYIISRKRYPQYRCVGQIDRETKRSLYRNTGALLLQKVGNTLSTSFDTIVISSVIGLSSVAIFGNYQYISASVSQLINLVFSAIIASVGNSIVTETLQKNREDFRDISFWSYWLVGWCTICIICLMQNFEWIWTSGTMMLDDATMLMIALCFYFTNIRRPVCTYKDALGIWYTDKFKPLIGGIFNLTMNLILVRIWGISGVVISTILSYVLIEIPWENRVLFKQYFQEKTSGYYLDCGYMMLSTAVAGAMTYVCCRFSGYGVGHMLARMAICVVVPNVIMLLLNFWRNQFRSAWRIAQRILQIFRR